MKIKIPIYWDFKNQEENEVIVNVPHAVVKKVLISFLMHKDYGARRDWLVKNVPFSMIDTPKELMRK